LGAYHGFAVATAISIISIVIAMVALTVNLSGLVRRPRIVAEWGWVQESPPYEGLSILVTARRRAVEIDEVGLVLLPKRTSRRRLPEWLNADLPLRIRIPIREKTPKLLQDGQTVRGFAELESVGEQIGDRPGPVYAYVIASGHVFLTPSHSRLRKRLRRRLGS
jgi:hypothetical protein